MASHGAFIAACGYEYHGPKGFLAFAPRVTPEYFLCDGHGSVRHLAFAVADKRENVTVTVNTRPVASAHVFEKGRVKITLAADAVITAGEKIEVTVE